MDWNLLYLTVGFAAMVFARRWRNNDSKAGGGIAAWGVVTVIVYIASAYS